jgi:hypothetical protein
MRSGVSLFRYRRRTGIVTHSLRIVGDVELLNELVDEGWPTSQRDLMWPLRDVRKMTQKETGSENRVKQITASCPQGRGVRVVSGCSLGSGGPGGTGKSSAAGFAEESADEREAASAGFDSSGVRSEERDMPSSFRGMQCEESIRQTERC